MQGDSSTAILRAKINWFVILIWRYSSPTLISRYYRNYPNCVRRKSTTYNLMFLYFYVSYQKLGWRSPYCLVQNISNFIFVELLFFPSHFELSIQARFKIIMILTKFTHKITLQNKQRIFSSHHLRWKHFSYLPNDA